MGIQLLPGRGCTHLVPRNGNLVSQNFFLKNWLLPSWGTVADAALAEQWKGCPVPSSLGYDKVDFGMEQRKSIFAAGIGMLRYPA